MRCNDALQNPSPTWIHLLNPTVSVLFTFFQPSKPHFDHYMLLESNCKNCKNTPYRKHFVQKLFRKILFFLTNLRLIIAHFDLIHSLSLPEMDIDLISQNNTHGLMLSFNFKVTIVQNSLQSRRRKQGTPFFFLLLFNFHFKSPNKVKISG